MTFAECTEERDLLGFEARHSDTLQQGRPFSSLEFGLPSSTLIPFLGGLGSLINPFKQERAPLFRPWLLGSLVGLLFGIWGSYLEPRHVRSYGHLLWVLVVRESYFLGFPCFRKPYVFLRGFMNGPTSSELSRPSYYSVQGACTARLLAQLGARKGFWHIGLRCARMGHCPLIPSKHQFYRLIWGLTSARDCFRENRVNLLRQESKYCRR